MSASTALSDIGPQPTAKSVGTSSASGPDRIVLAAQDAHRGAELGARPQAKLAALDDGGGIDDRAARDRRPPARRARARCRDASRACSPRKSRARPRARERDACAANRKVFFAPCSSSSPRCTASATTSSCSMRRATAACPPPRSGARCPPATPGIGFDQALVLEPPRRAGTDVYYRIFNADGGEVEQCGNGVRCLASFLHRRGDVANGSGEIVLDSPAGLDPRAHSRRQPHLRRHGRAQFRPEVPALRSFRRSARLSARRRGHRSRDRRGVHGQSARGAHGHLGRERARGSARARDRASPALPEARERRVHGNRRSHAHPAARFRAWRRRNARLRHGRVRGCRGRQTSRPARFHRRSRTAGRKARDHLDRARRTYLDERPDRCIFHRAASRF